MSMAQQITAIRVHQQPLDALVLYKPFFAEPVMAMAESQPTFGPERT